MPRPRLSRAQAELTGAYARNPKRYDARIEPAASGELGDPPHWMTDGANGMAATAWRAISAEVPWLNASHRALTAIAATLLGRVMAGQEVGVQALNLLRQCLGQMGATPADASKAGGKPDGPSADPADEFF